MWWRVRSLYCVLRRWLTRGWPGPCAKPASPDAIKDDAAATFSLTVGPGMPAMSVSVPRAAAAEALIQWYGRGDPASTGPGEPGSSIRETSRETDPPAAAALPDDVPPEPPIVRWSWPALAGGGLQDETGSREHLVAFLRSGRRAEGLRIHGSLRLSGLGVRSLPAGMTVEGDLDASDCPRLRHVGDRLRVLGSLTIGGAAIAVGGAERQAGSRGKHPRAASGRHAPLPALPPTVVVGGDMVLRGCLQLRRLPPRLSVGGSLVIVGCRSLDTLADGLQVPGDLFIVGCPTLRKLPAGLSVGGDLRLSGTAVERLPDDLRVRGRLVLEHCGNLRTLPDSLDEAVKALRIRCCPLERLPENLRVAENLFLAKLPRLDKLPPGLEVGGNLTVKDCRTLVDLPPALTVPGTVDLSGCAALVRLPAGLRVGGDLKATDCKQLLELPAGLAVRGRVDLGGCVSLAALPRGLRVRSLSVRGCTSLQSLPEDLHVSEFVEVAGAGITSVPVAVQSTVQFRWHGVRVPAATILRPETLPPEQVLLEPNAEVRRVILERVGIENVLARCDAKELDRDTDAGGERQLVEVSVTHSPWVASGVYRFLVCRCPSTARRYLLRVPPDTTTCHAAAAWIAGFDDPAMYRPITET